MMGLLGCSGCGRGQGRGPSARAQLVTGRSGAAWRAVPARPQPSETSACLTKAAHGAPQRAAHVAADNPNVVRVPRGRPQRDGLGREAPEGAKGARVSGRSPAGGCDGGMGHAGRPQHVPVDEEVQRTPTGAWRQPRPHNQAVHAEKWHMAPGGRRADLLLKLMTARPPGLSTRCISLNTSSGRVR